MLIRRKLLYLVVGSSTSMLVLAGGSWWSLDIVQQSFAEVTGTTGPRQIAALESRQAGTDLAAAMAQVNAAMDVESLEVFSARATTLAKRLDPADHSLTIIVDAALAADLTRREAERAVTTSASSLQTLGRRLQAGIESAIGTIKKAKDATTLVNEASLKKANQLTSQVAELARINSRLERIRLNCFQVGMITSRFKLGVPSATLGETLDDLAKRKMDLPDFDRDLATLASDLRASLLSDQGALPLRKIALALPENERAAALAAAQIPMDKALAQLSTFEPLLATISDDLALANRQAITKQQVDHDHLRAADQALDLCQELNNTVHSLQQAVEELERARNTAGITATAAAITKLRTHAETLLPQITSASGKLALDHDSSLEDLATGLKKLGQELTGSASLEASVSARLLAQDAAAAARSKQHDILTLLAKTAETASAGAAEAQVAAVTKVARTTSAATFASLVMAGTASAIALAIGWLVTRQISRGLHQACIALERDDGQRLQVHGDDEIARLTKALNATIDRIAGNRDQVLNKALALAQTADHMGGIADGLSANVATAERESASVATSAEAAANAVASVATAAEELSASVQEIAKAAGNAAGASNEALATAQATSAALSRLAKTAQDIATAAQSINNIAKQTNLLSLNATIEATRAGDAGKGFAVVAQEVKALARKAGDAAQSIGTLLATIDAEANSSTQAMEQAVAAAGRINEFTGSIAAAVEQQAATTNEISRVAHDAAQATGAAAAGVQRVAAATASVAASGQDTRNTAQALSRLADDLKALTRHG